MTQRSEVTDSSVDQVEPRRRLHPLSPMLHSAKSLAVIVAAISWQGYAQLGIGSWAALVLLLLVGAVILSVVSWFMTGYHVMGRELRVYEGVLWRRTRAIPLERLQSVEVVRPLLARLTGLAELRLEVVGGAKTEAPLAYLTIRDAALLRDRLLGLAGRLSAPAADRSPALSPGADPDAGLTRAAPLGTAAEQGMSLPAEPDAGQPWGPVGPPAARPLHAVNNRDVVIGQLLTPQVWSLPIALAFVVAQALNAASWGFIGIASTLTAVAGIVLQPARRVLDDWNFRLASDEAGLRVRHGLVETRSQTVPTDRIQAVRVTWPLLWRPNDWLRMRLDVAGFAGPEQQKGGPADHLLPVGDLDTARRLLPEVLPGVDLAGLRVSAPPRRARWLGPLAQPRIGVALTDEVFAARSGVLTRRLALVPYARIQSVRIVQGPLQRLLGLATVYADTAAGNASAEHRDLAEARAVAAELTDRARLARARFARA
jgi:putative membrane protein